MTSIEDLVDKVDVYRCVGIQITNNTRGDTLENPRTYCFSGWVKNEPVPQISPGSSESCVFVKTSGTACGSVGVLSYESDTFTLAIMFSSPYDHVQYRNEFALEVFPGRKHFDSMERLYQYMYSYDPPYICESFQKMMLTDGKDGELEVTNEKIQVKATMSNQYKSIIKVQIEEKNPCPNMTK
ncbi:DELTA-actitoxin-Aeq1c-like [Mauremys reevesii]|uniref:DELTA-actitoxin-Aeq1c-like n=1 Tax=Mauremys reevesii TaxID=260615 RepID=UPI0019401C40|nr:DELTA-actitoxin-Aeq1c-like [Mauremys reevesii]XP_039365683.1 DELTA-actitoxin-Aeq1c-like [Mauremys reevesii]